MLVDPEDEDAFTTIPPGVIPPAWRLTRRIGRARHPGPFADVGHVRIALASRLVHYGLDDLDGSDLRRRLPNAFTQELSRHVFENGFTEADEPLLGIRYLSRLGDDIENWAIFEGSEPYDTTSDESPATTPISSRR